MDEHVRPIIASNKTEALCVVESRVRSSGSTTQRASVLLDEHVRPIIASNKTEALCVVEPLDLTLDSGHLHFPPYWHTTALGRSRGMPFNSLNCGCTVILCHMTNVVKLVHRWHLLELQRLQVFL